MTSDFLLDAVGLIDDDLIQDAEALPAPRSIRPLVRKYASLAACLALVAAMGYGLTHMGMGGDSSAPACSAGNSAPGELEDLVPPTDASGSSCDTAESSGHIYLYDAEYVLTGEIVDVLPENIQGAGVLGPLSPDGPFPATDAEDYVGCLLWQAPDGLLYLQLPELGWAVAEPIQP